jgi:hypothetical protein
MKYRKYIASVLAGAAIYCSLSLLFLVAVQGAGHAREHLVHEAVTRDDAGAAAAFEAIIPVLRHPRCMNCHSSGDFPRQGDDSHRHTMQIRRGDDGRGANAVKCSTCHQDHNLAGLHMPPGAPGWQLPSAATPMIWEGLSGHQLCELLKDPQQNGHRTPEQIVEHMHTPLVLWGWSPGQGRTPVATPQHEFLANVQEWAAKGAACPADTTAAIVPGTSASQY